MEPEWGRTNVYRLPPFKSQRSFPTPFPVRVGTPQHNPNRGMPKYIHKTPSGKYRIRLLADWPSGRGRKDIGYYKSIKTAKLVLKALKRMYRNRVPRERERLTITIPNRASGEQQREVKCTELPTPCTPENPTYSADDGPESPNLLSYHVQSQRSEDSFEDVLLSEACNEECTDVQM